MTDRRLEGKAALVTGSTKGIGLSIARAFAREGARVIVNSRSAEDCARMARELGEAAIPIAADLSRTDEVRRLAKEARAAVGGRIDILVNNAGQ
ncbi:MAG TPA: SDR family NAD(P)-dependent oxidoreductase, partial [Methylomirabilota bacterium]|nr:SDR family NAD(P)-dependent oxidoreductase [Methylomirabilota bacterium]